MLKVAPVIIRDGQNYSVISYCWNNWLPFWGKHQGKFLPHTLHQINSLGSTVRNVFLKQKNKNKTIFVILLGRKKCILALGGKEILNLNANKE